MIEIIVIQHRESFQDSPVRTQLFYPNPETKLTLVQQTKIIRKRLPDGQMSLERRLPH